MNIKPIPQADAVSGPVREYLAVIADALNIPSPANISAREADRLAEDRIRFVRTSLLGLLQELDDGSGDVAFDICWLRKQVEKTPVTYEVYVTPDVEQVPAVGLPEAWRKQVSA